MKLKRLSIKNFIGDLPKIINECWDVIEKYFAQVYDEENNTIGKSSTAMKCSKLDSTDGIVSHKDIKIELSNDITISLIDLYEKVSDLEKDKLLSSTNSLPKKKLQ